MRTRKLVSVAIAAVVAPALTVTVLVRAIAAGAIPWLVLPGAAGLSVFSAVSMWTIHSQMARGDGSMMAGDGGLFSGGGGLSSGGHNQERTLRDRIPESHQAAIPDEQLDRTTDEQPLPDGVFYYPLAFAGGMVFFAATAILLGVRP